MAGCSMRASAGSKPSASQSMARKVTAASVLHLARVMGAASVKAVDAVLGPQMQDAVCTRGRS